jgi:hypothetical protein
MSVYVYVGSINDVELSDFLNQRREIGMSRREEQIRVTATYLDLYPEHYAHPMGRCLIRNGICVAEGCSLLCSHSISRSRGGAPLWRRARQAEARLLCP